MNSSTLKEGPCFSSFASSTFEESKHNYTVLTAEQSICAKKHPASVSVKHSL